MGESITRPMRTILFAAALSIMPLIAYAEKWLPVFTYPTGRTIYVDLESISRTGETTAIDTQDKFETGEKRSGRLAFNCDKKTYRVPKTDEMREVLKGPPAVAAVFEKTCKKPWEVWK